MAVWRRAWNLVGVLALATMFGTTLVYAADAKRPNILWIVSEDNDPFLGCYGDPRAHTPNLDKLAAEGVLYLNAFANAPVCAPSRSTLITGMYASTTGTLHMRSRYPIPADMKYYCSRLRDAGYYCMNPGKTDFNVLGDDTAHWNKGRSWNDAPAGKPWMLVLNSMTTHESCLHGSTVHADYLKEDFQLPPYHPDTPEIRSNWVEYYHKMTKMDAEFGAILDGLARDGLADDTIVFYYSDHGGILPRSKRFVYDSGLHVPLIVRFGKNVQHLAPAAPGTKLDRLVSFVDLAPTLCSLAGAPMPEPCQGRAFMGPLNAAEREYVFGFRGRMDESYDLSYTVRDKRFRYIRNYMPHRIYGQHLSYLWKMPATASWEKEFLAGRCNEVQSAFWKTKPSEELYDEQTDPYEVKNLANDASYKEVIERLRRALHDQLLQNRDAGLLPEPEMQARAGGGPIWMMTQDETRYPFARILEIADTATQRDAASIGKLLEAMQDKDSAVRYWAAVGCSVRGQAQVAGTDTALSGVQALVQDATPCVRIAAGEALCWMGQAKQGVAALVKELDASNGEFNVLMAANALEALGSLAQPQASEIAARASQYKLQSKAGDYVLPALEELRAKLGVTGK